ncbi:MAG: CBS domain-containing protein [Leptolyngbya sp. SIO1E4]|nr:CBS domain-containing protein [Leptolyngbya sp. SIO1E4]
MDLVLCHTTADFDTLGAAVGLTRLYPGARVVLAGGFHPTVQGFLALHRDEYLLIERRAVNMQAVQSLAVVDTQALERLGPIASWVTQVAEQGGEVVVYDHHQQADSTIPATVTHIDEVGATTTLITEALKAQSILLTIAEATVMALGIHVDTGSLTFASSTPRDAAALTWLMEQGASQAAIAEFVEPNLSPSLQVLLESAISQFQRESRTGHTLGWVMLEMPRHVPGLSGLAERLISLMDVDSLVLAAGYSLKTVKKLVLIGRARGRTAAQGDRPGVDFNQVFTPLGGGGHPTAASVTLTTETPAEVFHQVLSAVRAQIPPVPVARDVMSSPVRTIRPDTLITEAQRILLRYGHSGLSVVDSEGQLVGVISRRDIDLALHHGFGHAPVKGYMTTQVKTIAPSTSLPDIEALMVTYDIGRLPVIESGNLVGVVTRTDVLRQLHQDQQGKADQTSGLSVPLARPPLASQLWSTLQQRLTPALWAMLEDMAAVAFEQGWHLYLVGGAVRDLLLTPASEPLALQDVDLVVDSAYQTLEMGAGVVLAQAVQAKHPEAELQIYGRFQTAALVWHEDRVHNRAPLMVDIATARTEFYPYPAANPEVEASSIRQDLYRRDFTINALAIRLTQPRPGQLLDFFGGLLDLQRRHVRVLHANSFIEDPTRIYRGVRFAVRLGFTLEPQTEEFIRHAIESGVYKRLQAEMAKLPALQTRLKTELKYILEASYWEAALTLLNQLGALVCLHPALVLSDRLWQQLRRISRWLQQVEGLSGLTPWQMRLELLMTAIPPEARQTIAENLQLPLRSIQRLAGLADAEATLLAELPACDRPSQCFHLLQQYDIETLVLVSVRFPHRGGNRIWRYLMTWAHVKAPLTGNDLRQLGYLPGPGYRAMLEALLSATLDGEVTDRAAAVAFIAQKYPL